MKSFLLFPQTCLLKSNHISTLSSENEEFSWLKIFIFEFLGSKNKLTKFMSFVKCNNSEFWLPIKLPEQIFKKHLWPLGPQIFYFNWSGAGLGLDIILAFFQMILFWEDTSSCGGITSYFSKYSTEAEPRGDYLSLGI